MTQYRQNLNAVSSVHCTVPFLHACTEICSSAAGHSWMSQSQGQNGEQVMGGLVPTPTGGKQFFHHSNQSMGQAPFDPNPQHGDGRGLESMGPGDGSHDQISSQGQNCFIFCFADTFLTCATHTASFCFCTLCFSSRYHLVLSRQQRKSLCVHASMRACMPVSMCACFSILPHHDHFQWHSRKLVKSETGLDCLFCPEEFTACLILLAMVATIGSTFVSLTMKLCLLDADLLADLSASQLFAQADLAECNSPLKIVQIGGDDLFDDSEAAGNDFLLDAEGMP